MREVAHSVALGLALTLAFPSVGGAGEAKPATPEPVRLISPQRLVERIQAGEPIAFIDVRQPEEYAQGHIPGALNVPSGELAARKAELPRGSVLIPYCNMDFRGFVSARELAGLGFEVALLQERGLNGWRDSGLPVAGGSQGLGEDAALARLRGMSPAKLLGDRYVERVKPSGASRSFALEVSEWYFAPNQLQVDAGDELHITVTADKGDHFFILPDYEVQVAVPQGQTREVVFVADRAGVFKFGSCEWDGSALQVMKGDLEVRVPKTPAKR